LCKLRGVEREERRGEEGELVVREKWMLSLSRN